MIRGRWSRALVVTAAALLALVGAEVARAGKSTVQDGNDTPRASRHPLGVPGALGREGHAHDQDVRTLAAVALLDEQHSNSFLMLFNTDSDAVMERIVFVITARRRLAAGHPLRERKLPRAGERLSTRPALPAGDISPRAASATRPATAGRPSRRSRRRADAVEDVSTGRRTDPGACGTTCGTPRRLPAAASAVDQLVRPRVHRRRRRRVGPRLLAARAPDPGTTAWMELAEGSTTGSKTVPFTETTGSMEEFRVVARDEHGNRTVSPVRLITVPPK